MFMLCRNKASALGPLKKGNVSTMETLEIREIASDAVRYWERRRPVYNAVLLTVVVGCFVARLPAAAAAITLDRALSLFALAVLANVAYCAVYVPDVFAQLSAFRDRWRDYRWSVLAVGCAFAAILTRSIVLSTLDRL